MSDYSDEESSRTRSELNLVTGKECLGHLQEGLDISISSDLYDITEISNACKSTPEWSEFNQLDLINTEEEYSTRWTKLFNTISKLCKLKPMLHFSYVGGDYMDANEYYLDGYDQVPRSKDKWGKPDIAILSGAPDRIPSWKNAEFLGAVHKEENMLDQLGVLGQIGQYLHNQRLHQSFLAARYGLILAGKKVRLISMDPAGCKRSNVVDACNIESLIKLVIFLCEILEKSYGRRKWNEPIWLVPFPDMNKT